MRYPSLYDEMPVFLLCAGVLANLSFVVAGIFRCKDIGWSGWRVLVFLVPVANLVLVFILMFRRRPACLGSEERTNER
jgi:uncharacterized membrane protein YhaH (DUF805 family)